MMNSGLLIIDKPSGYTSRDIVNMVGRFLNTKKVGHCGTLDPIATGVLVIAVNDALKILEFMSNDTKEYIATVKFGISTDTLDISGNILEQNKNYFLDVVKLNDVINSFKGKYFQEVPLYSSVKVNGKRLYKYAREKEAVLLPKKQVEIFEIELLSYNHEGFSFRTVVSKGTYIRSLIRDIGVKMNILCTMSNLRRIRQGIFSIDDAISLEDIENNRLKFIPIEKPLSMYHSEIIDGYLEKKILNGSILDNLYDKEIVVFKNKDHKALAIYKIYDKNKKKIKPIKVLKKRD